MIVSKNCVHDFKGGKRLSARTVYMISEPEHLSFLKTWLWDFIESKEK